LKRLARDQEHRRSELFNELTVKAYSGDLTSHWRKQHYSAVAEAANTRDQLLQELGVKVATPPAIVKPAARSPEVAFRLSRAWLMNELSEFQLGVFYAFTAYAEQPLLAEDPEIFARFCESEELIERVEPFGPAQNNRIRRTLSQLSALGLIAKVTLPKQNQETGEREYLKAFRPLREEEFTRLTDAVALRNALGVGGEPQPEIES
jgi:type I restriction enzyme S subunit